MNRVKGGAGSGHAVRTTCPQGVSVDSFVEAAVQLEDCGSLVEAFKSALHKAGFVNIVYYQLLRRFERLTLEQGERIALSPRRLHPEIKTFDFDPWIAVRLGAMQPFTWRDFPTESDLAPETLAIIEALRREGVRNAVTIPVSLRAGDLAAFFVTRRDGPVDLEPATMMKLQLLCFVLHARYEALTPDAPQRQLSPRELDVMKLAAVGRTNAEIARELGVSVHTVNTLIRRSYVKLGATNRVEASIRLAYIARRGGGE